MCNSTPVSSPPVPVSSSPDSASEAATFSKLEDSTPSTGLSPGKKHTALTKVSPFKRAKPSNDADTTLAVILHQQLDRLQQVQSENKLLGQQLQDHQYQLSTLQNYKQDYDLLKEKYDSLNADFV